MVISLQDWREGRKIVPSPGELDWNVVEMARTDGALSLNPDGVLARLARKLLSVPVAHRLPDEKLEALRRFSVRAWHWDLIRDKDLRAFLDAGYSRIHVLEILSRIGMIRGFTPSIEYEARPHASRGRSLHCRCG